VHILLIHQAFAGLDEAGGTRHIEMARTLVERGHRVTVIASPVSYLTGRVRSQRMRWVERQDVEPEIVILRTYTYSAWHRSFVHRVFSFISFMFSSFWVGLNVRAVDVVWGTSPPIFQGWTAWLLARLKGAKFVFEVRDLWPAFAIAVGVLRNRLLIRLSLWLESFLYRHADGVIVNSPGFIEHVQVRGAAQVRLIPNGASPEMFDPRGRGESFRQAHGLEERFVVLYAGAHGLSNDLEVVLQAAAQLMEETEIVFLLVGDGKEKRKLQEKAQALELKNVCFLPPVSKQAMAEVLAAADAGLAILKPLELYRTTYPNKVFDYMAAGRAVLLAIDGVARQVVEEAQAGLFVEPGNPAALAEAVKTLADDRQRTWRMGMAGRIYVEQHLNRRDITNHFADYLESLVLNRDG
jgi:glycosyltransferase involved in cell wall biosynthesis